MRAPLPIVRWPANPACPPAMTKSPSLVLPEMPTWPAKIQPRPITTLCPICTRLSIIVPGPITVSCPEPRSIVVLAPISTSSPMITRPSCGTLTGPFGSGAKPNPAWPMRTPGCSTTRAPIRQWLSVTLAPTRQSSPSSTAAAMTVLGPIRHRAPKRTPASMTTCAPISQSAGTVAVGSMMALGARPRRGSAVGIEGLRRARESLVRLARDQERHPRGRLVAADGRSSTKAAPARDRLKASVYLRLSRNVTSSGPAVSSGATSRTSRAPSAGSSRRAPLSSASAARLCGPARSKKRESAIAATPSACRPVQPHAATAFSWNSASAGCASALAGVSAAKLTVSVGNCSSSFDST